MLCYWGAQIREGFGLTQPDKVKHVNDGIRCVCPTSEIQDMSAGRYLVGFIRNEKVSVLRLRGHNNGHDGKLKPLNLKKDRIKSIACGESSGVVLAHGGKVFIINKSTVCTPLKDLANRHVIQVACGDQHSMALTQEGQVFVWGENSHGQLGLGEGRSGSQTPRHVQCLDGVPLAQISAGGDHSFVLSLSGVVFGWGKNSSGQLGLGDTTDRHVPTVVRSLKGKKTQCISCGGEHTATLSKGGTVFTFGSGVYGQLGHNSFKDEHLPGVVAELWGSKVSQITCGRHHTLVLVASSMRIYSFGCGTQGQLGNGQMTNQSVPSPVHLPAELNDKYTIGKLFAGENHSFALLYKVPGNKSTKPKSNQSRRIVTLDDKMIDQWVSECNSKSWKAIKNQIYKVFSSAASLNGSFLKTSCDEHYETSVEVSGLDFEPVKKTFAKLSVDERMMSKVVKTVHGTLLPSLETLSVDPSLVSVEVLRVYLLLPELIRVCQEQHGAELLEAFASKILQLKFDALKVLETYWSKLPDDCFKGLVKLFRTESAKLIGSIACDKINRDSLRRLQKFMQVLQMIYKVCSSHNDITSRDFIIHNVNDLLDMLQVTLEDIVSCFLFDNISEMLVLSDHFVKTIEMLVNFPLWLTRHLNGEFLKSQDPQLTLFLTGSTLHINRNLILKDTLQYLRQGNHSFQHLLKVKFVGEDGIDGGALSAEFFSLLSQSLFTWEKKLLKVENSLVWFNSEHTCKEDFYYLGVVCGMALFNHCYMNLEFPLALFKKLLDLSITLSDLEEISPVEARSLRNLLEEEEEVVEMLFLDFRIKGQELIPNGAQIPITTVNRQKYVDLYVDFIFNMSVKNQFEQFSAGFSEGCPVKAWKMFHPEELREVFSGSPEYEWEDLQKCATYEHCSPSDELIKNFWTIFFELSEENKKKFLIFMYGTGRVPAGGLSKVTLKIVLLNKTDSDDHLPEAQTCFGKLLLPKYSDINTLRNKLIHAISFCEVFGRG